MHMHRHAHDEGLGQERARQCDDADQEREGDDLRAEHAGQPEHQCLYDADRDRHRRVGGDQAPATPAAIKSESRITPEPAVPPTTTP